MSVIRSVIIRHVYDWKLGCEENSDRPNDFAYMLSESIERELGLDVETTPDLGAGSVCMSSIQSK